jgi:AcrR family transcriptional regulator
MPAPTLSRDEVIARILAVFRRHGYEGASLSRMSQETGLGRSSLYHYFPNGKKDMGAAALAIVGEWIDKHAMAELSGPGSPRLRLTRYAARMAEFYGNGSKACLMNLFCIGDAADLFQRQLGTRAKQLIKALAQVAQEAGVAPAEAALRAEKAVVAMEGALVISRALGSRVSFQRVIEEFPDLLLRD